MLLLLRLALLVALVLTGFVLLVWQVSLAPDADLAMAAAIAVISLLMAAGLTVLAGHRGRRPTEAKSRNRGERWLPLGLFAMPFIALLPGFARVAVLGTLTGVLIGSVVRAARAYFAKPSYEGLAQKRR